MKTCRTFNWVKKTRPSSWLGITAQPGGLVLCCLFTLWLAGCAAPSTSAPPAAPSKAPVAATSAPATQSPAVEPDSLSKLAAIPTPAFEGEGWQDLFDGQTLKGWAETHFSGRGEVQVQEGLVLAKMGDPFTGLNFTNDFPKINYELALDAARVEGSDFFCALTVPVNDSFCSLIVGGWGGALVGISSLDGMDASENETSKYVTFQQRKWYRIRLRVTSDRIEGWIDQEKLIDVVTTGRKISLRPGEIEESKPFGIACWQTTAAWRNIKVRHVDGPAGKPKKF
jgi:hypothetical protein